MVNGSGTRAQFGSHCAGLKPIDNLVLDSQHTILCCKAPSRPMSLDCMNDCPSKQRYSGPIKALRLLLRERGQLAVVTADGAMATLNNHTTFSPSASSAHT
jgi:hypothetical protein